MAMLRCPNDGTSLVALADDDSALIGLEIDGRFTIESKLGSGGMGGVYVAVQHSIGRAVAIKVIHGHLSRDRNSAKRFLRETKLASRLSHPNTVTVLDFGQTADHRLYMVMEMVDGETLSAIIKKGPLASERAIEIAIQICGALEAAAKLQIVHRDLKPANIMIEAGSAGRDFVKVLDFGLAKSLASEDSTVTESHMIVGTPHYLPPELALGDPVDTRSDLYSLGVVLFAMVAGKLPFRGETVQAVLFSQVNDPPPPLPASVPSDLANVILRLLAKRPDLRFQSASQTRAALVAARDRAAAVIHGKESEPSIGTDATLRPDATLQPSREPSNLAAADPDASLVPNFSSIDATATKSPRLGSVSSNAKTNTEHRSDSEAVAVAPMRIEMRIEEPATPRRRWLKPIVALAVLAAGVGGLLAMQGGGDASQNATGEPSDPQAQANDLPRASPKTATQPPANFGAVAADAGSSPPTPVRHSRVIIELKSRPRGARAVIEGAGQCVTPCSIEVAQSSQQATIEFSKSGHQASSRLFSADRDQTVIGELKRRRRARTTPDPNEASAAADPVSTKPKDDFIPSYED